MLLKSENSGTLAINILRCYQRAMCVHKMHMKSLKDCLIPLALFEQLDLLDHDHNRQVLTVIVISKGEC